MNGGWVDGITFRQTSSGGQATTTLTPRSRDLSVQPTDDGGGVIGSVKHWIQFLWFGLRDGLKGALKK